MNKDKYFQLSTLNKLNQHLNMRHSSRLLVTIHMGHGKPFMKCHMLIALGHYPIRLYWIKT